MLKTGQKKFAQSGNTYGSNWLYDLSRELRTNDTLTHLEFRFFGFGDLGLRWIEDIFNFNTTITTLVLHDGGIEGAEPIRDILETSKTLKHLDISENEFESEEFAHILRGLENNTTLETINLEGLDLSRDQADQFESFIGKTGLKEIRLSLKYEVDDDAVCETFRNSNHSATIWVDEQEVQGRKKART